MTWMTGSPRDRAAVAAPRTSFRTSRTNQGESRCSRRAPLKRRRGALHESFACNTPHRSPAVRTTAAELLRGSRLGRLLRSRGRGLLRLLGLLGALGGVSLGSVVSESGEGGGEDEGGDQLL